jgi:hypothetical protein
MKTLSKPSIVPLVLLCGLLVAGCKKHQDATVGGGSSAASSSGIVSSSGVPVTFRDLRKVPGTVFDVTFTPNTVQIDLPTAQKCLKSVSDDGRVFVFECDDPRLQRLKEGAVMFLEHLGVRRVIAVHTEGAQIGVMTDTAAFTDFIQDGTIQFSVPVNFAELQARNVPEANLEDELASNFPNWLSPPAVEAAAENSSKYGLHTKGETDGWEFEIEGEPEGDGLKLSLTAAKKKLVGMTPSVKVTGQLEHVSTAFKAVVHGGQMQDFNYSTPLKGHINVNWSVITMQAGSGIGEARLKLPPFAKQVFDVYGIPFLFKVDEALIFTPGFGGKKDAAEGGFNVTYDGSGGLSVQGEKSSPQGAMDAQPEPEKTTAESLAPHGVVLAVNAPKISVSLGTDSIKEAIKQAIPGGLSDKVGEFLEKGPFGGLFKSPKEDFFKIEGAAYVQLVTEFDYTGSGPLSIVPCSLTRLNFYAQAGADATAFALKGASPTVKITEAHITNRQPDINACGEK